MKQSCLALLFALFLTLNFYGQYQINGKVLDAETKENLAFANITFNNNKKRGVITDIDGKFVYKSNKPIKNIEVSYLGYQTLKLKPDSNTNLIIALKPALESLDEVVITNAENPALRIVKQVIANKALNNPLKKGGFRYTSYNKSIIDKEGRQEESDSLRQVFLEQIEKGELDPESDTLGGFEKTLIREGNFNIMLFESVTKRKFLPPDLSEETVVATRVSGFKDPYFAVLATELQPFGFYEDNINLMDLHFLNPIAKGSIKRYDYTLEEKISRGNDTIFNISFQPKPDANIDGLKGFMYINSDAYAIQNIVAEPYDKLITHLKIQQKYKRIADKQWFPEQLNFEFTTQQGIFINGNTYLKDIKFTDSLKPKDFSEVQLKYQDDAPKRDKTFWNQYRVDSLSQTDKNTYKVVDSIGERLKLDKVLDVVTSLSDGYVPWGKFNIPFNRFFGYNSHEGFRLGAGLETNDKFLKNVILGGYTAYGFKDSEWKFGAKARYNINESDDMFLQFNYNNDVREIGRSTINNQNFSGRSNLRSFIASRMDLVEHFQIEFGRRDFKYLSWRIGLRNEWIRPQFNYAFVNNSNNITNFRNTEAVINLRYAFRERIVQTPKKRISLGTTYPVFNLRYTKGFDSFLDGAFDYQKIEASLSHSFFSRNFGQTRYHIQAGYIDSDIPLDLLFTGEGSNDDDIPIVMPDTFQTMLPYEFLSDQYVHLFLTHDLGSLLFKAKDFNPGLILHHNMGWGDLEHPQSHNWNFNTKEQIFIESGLEVTKILKLNYLDAFYAGIGAGGFYRYGFYSFDKSSDNFVFKLNVTFTLN
ncbi:MAG: carboxypeptidase-like regulatory domain-containing protein [Psychroflexus sp.]|nr:carboxypeptidase-like regulatory domain-containing protein [Psychroflexus sp.]